MIVMIVMLFMLMLMMFMLFMLMVTTKRWSVFAPRGNQLQINSCHGALAFLARGVTHVHTCLPILNVLMCILVHVYTLTCLLIHILYTSAFIYMLFASYYILVVEYG